jgi:hypothetical protein
MNCYPIRANFGLLPEAEKSPASFFTSAVINLTAMVLDLRMRRHVVQQHKYEQTRLIFPIRSA